MRAALYSSPSGARQAVEEFGPKLNMVPLESKSEALLSDIKCLNNEIADNERHLRLNLAGILRERAQMLDLLTAKEQTPLTFQRGESLVAQAVLAVQNRSK